MKSFDKNRSQDQNFANGGEEDLLEFLLKMEFQSREVPDLSRSILEEAQNSERKGAKEQDLSYQGSLVKKGNDRSKKFSLRTLLSDKKRGWLATAAIIIGALLVIFPLLSREQAPASNPAESGGGPLATQVSPIWQPQVFFTEAARYTVEKNQKTQEIKLLEGWIFLEQSSPEAISNNHFEIGKEKLTQLNGRAVLTMSSLIDFKDQAGLQKLIERCEEEGLLQRGKDKNMLQDLKRWTIQGSLALCVLSGSVFVNGKAVNAEDNASPALVKKDKALENLIDTATNYSTRRVTSLEDIKALDPDVDWIIDGQNLDNEALNMLVTHLPNIRKLVLSGEQKFNDQGMKAIGLLTNLEELDLSWKHEMESTGISVQGLEYLQNLTQLRTLNLSDAGLHDQHLEVIGRLSSLEKLDLGNPGLAPWENGPMVNHMWAVQPNRFTGGGLAHLKGLSNLREFNGLGAIGEDSGLLEFLREVGPRLESLSLEYCHGLSSDTLKQALSFTSDSLHFLDISECVINDDILKTITENAYALEVLGLRGCEEVNDQNISVLVNLSLKKLWLDYCQGIETLDRLLYGTQEVTPARLFSANLEELSLYRCLNVRDKVLSNISFSATFSLKTLNLSGCKKITDEGLKGLVLGHWSLEELNLEDCELLTDQALEPISTIKTLKKLNLDIIDSKFTQAAITKLQEALPECEIRLPHKFRDGGLATPPARVDEERETTPAVPEK